MNALDEASEAYIARLLEQAPPLTPEAAALVVRVFAPKAASGCGRSATTGQTAA